jgi:hypothetical protein
VACGGAGQPCCSGAVCKDANTLCNSSNLCVVCGTPGTSTSTSTPCCAGNLCNGGCCVTRFSYDYASPVCMAAGKTCDSMDTSTSTTPKAVCDVTTVATGTCTAGTTSCGGAGQPCCVSTYYSSSTYYNYCAAPGTRCLASTSSTTGATQYLCSPCGDKGQRCCYDGTSSSSSSSYYGYGSGCKSPYVCSYTSSTGTSTYTCVAAASTSGSSTSLE